VLTAWKRHITLMDNAKKFEAQADNLQMAMYALAVVTTTVSVTYSMENAALALAAAGGGNESEAEVPARMLSEESSSPLPDLSAQGYSILMLPLLAALVSTVRARLRPREKWGTCLMAASQIVDQIYKYRLRTDKYDTQAAPPPDKDGNIPEISPKMRETNARQMFVETVGQIYSGAISTEVSKGGALKMSNAVKLQTQNDEGRQQFESYLQGHIKNKLHAGNEEFKGAAAASLSKGQKKAQKEAQKQAKAMAASAATGALAKKGGMLGKLLGGKSNKIAAAMAAQATDMMDEEVKAGAQGVGVGGAADAEDDTGGGMDEVDDMVSQMAVETYVACRVRSIADYLEKRAVVMSKRNQTLEFAIVAINTGSSVLSVVGYADYISISTAIASQCMALLDYFYIPSQLVTTNKALENCHNLLTWWDSLSLVQRKTRAVKKQCCLTVEGALLEMVGARTTVSTALPGEQGDAPEEE